MRLAESARRAGYRLNSFEHLGSTNDEAIGRAAAGDRGQLWVVATSQSAGRGRQGRTWLSPAGNLYASLLLVDVGAPGQAAELGFVAGIAFVDAVAACLRGAATVALKWPNDLLAGQSKLGGILVEGTRTPAGSFAVVIGFGLNCTWHPDGMPYPTTSLAALAEWGPSRDEIFEALSDRLPQVLATWNRGRDFSAIRDLWLARTMPMGTPMSVSAKGGRLAGHFETMDARGRLVLATAEGRASIDVGDVTVLERSALEG